MSIIVKHIFRNMKEKKGRTVLIIMALMVATTVFTLNLTLPDEIMLKYEATLRSIYGNADVVISSDQAISIEDINTNGEKILCVGTKSVSANKGKEQVLLFGLDVNEAKESKMIGEDVPQIDNGEAVICNNKAQKYGINEGEEVTIAYEGKDYKFTIKKVVENKGLQSVQGDFITLVTSIDNLYELVGEEEKGYENLFIDVEDDDKIDDYVTYLKENNEKIAVERLVDPVSIAEATSYISSMMVMICAMATIMIFFVISSLNKIVLAQRMPVIGTFRSVGATKWKMNGILILENMMYGLVGGVLGSILAYAFNDKVAGAFFTSNGVEIASKNAKIAPSSIIFGILFAVILEILICIRAIMKVNKKPVKDIIFDVQGTRYRILKRRTISGILFIIASIVINHFVEDANTIVTISLLVLMIVGFFNIMPIILRGVSVATSAIAKKMSWGNGVLAGRNIGYNKMIISSSRLIVIAMSLMMTILMVSNSFRTFIDSARIGFEDYNLLIDYVEKSSDEYMKLEELDDIEKIGFMYLYGDDTVTYNQGQKFKTIPQILGADEPFSSISDEDVAIDKLEYDEALVDEKYAKKNGIEINDELTIHFETEDKTISFKVVGFMNSTYFTSARNMIIVNLKNYKDNITDVPFRVLMKSKSDADITKVKDDIKDVVNEIGLNVQTVDEYMEVQQSDIDSVMSIFYMIVGLAVVLSFVGIINNQTIGFIQRKKEFAVLNSTCMSRTQLMRMVITENVISNLVSLLIAVGGTCLLLMIVNSFMKCLELYVKVSMDFATAFAFSGIMFVVLLFTMVASLRQLKKMNIVNEIKYE